MINAVYVNDIGGPVIVDPVGTSNKSLGGGVFGLQVGVTDGTGLNTIGLLVKTSGTVTSVGADGFTIDDGSDVDVKCVVPTGIPSVDDYVAVTGVSSCEEVAGEVERVILVTSVTTF